MHFYRNFVRNPISVNSLRAFPQLWSHRFGLELDVVLPLRSRNSYLRALQERKSHTETCSGEQGVLHVC